MKQLKEFLIPFVGLKTGKHQFDYHIDRTFFDSFEFDEYEACSIDVKMVLEKKPTLMELHFKHKGTVTVPCDVSGEVFDLAVKGNLDMVVQFGQEFNNDNEELLILPHGEFQIDISQYIYEMIVLSVPLKRVRPGIATESIPAAEMDAQSSTAQVAQDNKEEDRTDPRWDKLKNLLTDK